MANRWRGFWPLLWLSSRAQALLLFLGFASLLVQVALTYAFPRMNVTSAITVVAVLLSTLAILVIVVVTQQFIVMAVYERPKRPTVHLLRSIAALFDARSVALGLPVFLSLVIFIFAFSNVKGNIPVIIPFSWDRTLDRWDLVLHFGRRPWEWLQPLLGHWPITFVINLIYNLWFVIMFTIWMQFAFFTAPGAERTRFFISFMLVWGLAGNGLAIAFSSAGPAFYGSGHLGLEPDPYAPLLAYLHEANSIVPIWAVSIQDDLWKLYLSASAEGSISAMPSLHNATALLFILASTGWPRWVRRLLYAFMAVIFLGSIHLAWHYAVDAYAGWVLMLLVWIAAAPLARWWEEGAVARRFRKAWEDRSLAPPAESPAMLGGRVGVG